MRPKQVSSLLFTFRIWINKSSKTIILLILPWLRYRLRVLLWKTLELKNPKRSKSLSLQIILLVIQRSLRRLRKSFKRGFKKRNTSKRTPALILLLLKVIWPSIIQCLKTLKKNFLESCVIVTTKKTIMLELVLSLKKITLKKTSSCLDNLCVNN